MKSKRYQVITILLLLLVWLMLSGTFTLESVLTGVLFAWLTMLLLKQLRRDEHADDIHHLKLTGIIKFVFYLTGQIYVSGFLMIRRIFTGNMNIGKVRIKTSLKYPLSISLLAASITLTPGTATIKREGAFLDILWVDCETKDPAVAGPLVKKKLETILLQSESALKERG